LDQKEIQVNIANLLGCLSKAAKKEKKHTENFLLTQGYYSKM
jgi:hypothetical protein